MGPSCGQGQNSVKWEQRAEQGSANPGCMQSGKERRVLVRHNQDKVGSDKPRATMQALKETMQKKEEEEEPEETY